MSTYNLKKEKEEKNQARSWSPRPQAPLLTGYGSPSRECSLQDLPSTACFLRPPARKEGAARPRGQLGSLRPRGRGSLAPGTHSALAPRLRTLALQAASVHTRLLPASTSSLWTPRQKIES